MHTHLGLQACKTTAMLSLVEFKVYLGNKRSPSPPIAFLVIFQSQTPRLRYFIKAAPKSGGFSLASLSLLLANYPMTADLFSQRPRTLRGNKRIKRLSGPPAWRMMRQGKVSPRETNQTIVWHSQTFSAVKPRSREMKRTGMELPFTEPCGNGLRRFHN